MDATKPLQLDPDLAKRLKAAAEQGETLAIEIDNRRYHLSVIPAQANKEDIWEG